MVKQQQRKLITPLRGAIVAMTHERVIGMDGGLPWHYTEDLRRFKKRTMGCVVIMGRKTWDSIGCRPLPGRQNVVMSRTKVEGVEHYRHIEQAINAYRKRRIWVIGGAQTYCAAMPYLTLLDITYVPSHIQRDNVVRFPAIDSTNWSSTKRKNKIPGENGLFYILHRRNLRNTENGTTDIQHV